MRELESYTQEILERAEREKKRIRSRRRALALAVPVVGLVLLGAFTLPRSPARPQEAPNSLTQSLSQAPDQAPESIADLPADSHGDRIPTGSARSLLVSVQDPALHERSLNPDKANSLHVLLSELDPTLTPEIAAGGTESGPWELMAIITVRIEGRAPVRYRLFDGLLENENTGTNIPLSPSQQAALLALLEPEEPEERSEP